MSKFGIKSALFGYFWARIFENIWNQQLRLCLVANFCEETKISKFATKNVILGYFDQKCLILVFLDKDFKKANVKFEISTLQFA